MATWGKVRSDDEEVALPARSSRREFRRERDLPRPVAEALQVDIARALGMVGGSTCVMTSAFEFKRGGILVRRVMQCADEPPCVLVSVPKGQRLATLIRDSHGFALNVVDPSQRLLIRKFEESEGLGGGSDPFDMLELRSMPTGAPGITRALAVLDCEVQRHFDLEADHEVYVGQVIAAVVFAKAHIGHGAANGHSGPSMAGAHAEIGASHGSSLVMPPAGTGVVKTPGRLAG